MLIFDLARFSWGINIRNELKVKTNIQRIFTQQTASIIVCQLFYQAHYQVSIPKNVQLKKFAFTKMLTNPQDAFQILVFSFNPFVVTDHVPNLENLMDNL